MHPDLKTCEKIDIGIISDTHGSLSPKALSALSRADVIVHAGDFDTPEVLAALEKLCPVIAVRGNMDHGSWATSLPAADMVELAGITLYIRHNLNALDLDPNSADVKVVISGHTHQAAAVRSNGILFLNPGSPTSPRYGTDASVAMLQVDQGRVRYRFIEVE
jgi:putative phosphoesterase